MRRREDGGDEAMKINCRECMESGGWIFFGYVWGPPCAAHKKP